MKKFLSIFLILFLSNAQPAEKNSMPTKEEIEALNKRLLIMAKMYPFNGNLIDLQEVIDKGANNLDESLLAATCHGKLPVIKILLKNGANPHTLDKFGNSTLLLALDRIYHLEKRTEAVKVLLEAGSDPFIKNNDGEDFFSTLKKFPMDTKIYNEYAQNVCNEVIAANANLPRELACIISDYVAPKIKK